MPYKRKYKYRRKRYRKRYKKRYGRKRYKKRYKRKGVTAKTVRRIVAKVIQRKRETFSKIKVPDDFFNQNNGWRGMANLTYAPTHTPTHEYNSVGVVKERLFNQADFNTLPEEEDHMAGDSFYIKGLLLQFSIEWGQFQLHSNQSLKWFIIQAPLCDGADSPTVNAGLFKGFFLTAPENEFKQARRNLGYKIIRKGTWYPPKRLTNNLLKVFPAFTATELPNNPTVLIQRPHITELASATYNGQTYNQSPQPIKTITNKTIYMKWKTGKKIGFRSLAADAYIHDRETAIIRNSNWWFVMFKTGITSNNVGLPAGGSILVKMRQQTWFCDN